MTPLEELEEYIDTLGTLWYFVANGAVAQMGERVTGSHKVVGSIPISSTNDFKGLGRWDFPAASLFGAVFNILYTFEELLTDRILDLALFGTEKVGVVKGG